MSKINYNINSTFNFRDLITYTGKNYALFGTIQGKIKGIDAYIVSLKVSSIWGWEMTFLITNVGVPNRHLEVEWGRFYGGDREFIIPGDKLTKVQR